MPRYRVLFSRPNQAFVDLIIEADNESEARRLACEMSWHDEAAAPGTALDTTLPVSIALYEQPAPPVDALPSVMGPSDDGASADDKTPTDEAGDDVPRPQEADEDGKVVSLEAFRRRRATP